MGRSHQLAGASPSQLIESRCDASQITNQSRYGYQRTSDKRHEGSPTPPAQSGERKISAGVKARLAPRGGAAPLAQSGKRKTSQQGVKARPAPRGGRSIPWPRAASGKNSGRPGSNRRHLAWEASTLPTELRPHILEVQD